MSMLHKRIKQELPSLDILRRLEAHVSTSNRLQAMEQAMQLPCPRLNLLNWAQVKPLISVKGTMLTYDAKFSRGRKDT